MAFAMLRRDTNCLVIIIIIIINLQMMTMMMMMLQVRVVSWSTTAPHSRAETAVVVARP